MDETTNEIQVKNDINAALRRYRRGVLANFIACFNKQTLATMIADYETSHERDKLPLDVAYIGLIEGLAIGVTKDEFERNRAYLKQERERLNSQNRE